MRLLHYNNDGKLSLIQFFDDIPRYAILSHTWGPEEVTFKDIIEGNEASKTGFDKIRFCGEQARRDRLQYFWVDTCCIDKSNAVELQEAINSMFRWYRNAVKCYAYLTDVSTKKRKASDSFTEYTWDPAFRSSKWFTRGWTLQELIAPTLVEFFSKDQELLGDKRRLERQIHEITGITISALRGVPLSQFDIEDRLSWAKDRQTTREEDKAYSLFGIFDIQIPLLYGEGGEKALKRLREEINKPLKDKAFKRLCEEGDISLKGEFEALDAPPYIEIKRSADRSTQSSTVFHPLRGRRSIHSTANKIPPAFPTPELTCYKRYATGPMDKMSGAYFGLMA